MLRLYPRALLLACLAAILVTGTSPFAIAQDATPTTGEVTILGPDESYAGVTQGEWAARWWQWTFSFPMEISPSFDPTGERCGYGQTGPVFFLPANYLERPVTITCVVPEGVAIFLTLGSANCSTVEPPPFFGRNEEELRACAAAHVDSLGGSWVYINGQEVPNVEDYRSSSPVFPLSFPVNHVFFEVPKEVSGVALAVAEGYSIIIAPLPPGEYEIGTFLDTYRVIVEAPQVIEPEAAPAGSPEAATPAA